MSNMAIVGQALDFDYLFPLYHVHMPITTRFYNATSNVYSLDFVFDGSAATITLSGVPISASALVNWTHLDNEDGWRIWVLATLAIDPSVKVDLPPVTPVWP